MGLSEGIPFKTCANPQARDQNMKRANLCENEMVQTYRDLNCSGASPIEKSAKQKRDRGRDSQRRPRPPLSSQLNGATQ